jgi:hypothetical protein
MATQLVTSPSDLSLSVAKRGTVSGLRIRRMKAWECMVSARVTLAGAGHITRGTKPMGGEQFDSIVTIVAAVLGFVLVILWLILPFVVMAMKGRLDRLIELVSVNNEITLESNRLLGKLASEVENSLKH